MEQTVAADPTVMELNQKLDRLVTQVEFLTDNIIQEIWRDGHREWNEYGKRQIRTTSGLPITMLATGRLKRSGSVLLASILSGPAKA